MQNISFIGSGKVASFLAKSFFKQGKTISNIYSRNYQNAKRLAEDVNAKAIGDISEIVEESDIIIVSVSDDSLENISALLPNVNTPIVHTSGMIPAATLSRKTDKFGKFYPLQTITSKTHDKVNIPILVYAQDTDLQNALVELAQGISSNVRSVDERDFKYLHLSAVLANNYVNAMYESAYKLLSQRNIDFSILFPLMEETLRQSKAYRPKDVQTGPAVRNDVNIMQEHLNLILEKADSSLVKVYREMASLIQQQHEDTSTI